MKQARNALIMVSMLVLVCVVGLVVALSTGYVPNGLHMLIIALILISAIYAVVTHLKKYGDTRGGFPAEDEMSSQIKYKAGYYSFLASLYLWLFIFLFHRFFNDVESMLGSGILVSAVMAMVIKAYLSRHYHEDQN
jgi:xanthine/uracil permease